MLTLDVLGRELRTLLLKVPLVHASLYAFDQLLLSMVNETSRVSMKQGKVHPQCQGNWQNDNGV